MGGAVEVACTIGLVLRKIVLVERERKLLGRVAHAVGTVCPAGGIGNDARADAAAVAADLVEERAIIAFGSGRFNGAGERCHHASAKLRIGRRWKG